jgi:hypothetical protein
MSNSSDPMPSEPESCNLKNQCVTFVSVGTFLGLIFCCYCCASLIRLWEWAENKQTPRTIITTTPLHNNPSHVEPTEEDPC